MSVHYIPGNQPYTQRIEILFDGVDPSDALQDRAEKLLTKVLLHHPRVLHATLTFSARHHHHHQGNLYHVALRLHLPEGEVNVSRDPEQNHAHEDVYVSLRDACDAARRQLDALDERNRGKGVQHALPRHQQRPSALRRQRNEELGTEQEGDG